MYRSPDRNPDRRPLQGDHTIPRSQGNTGPPDRLMLATCNASRGDGTRAARRAQGEWRRTSWTRDWLAGFDEPVPSYDPS
jgi:hypothetical protein